MIQSRFALQRLISFFVVRFLDKMISLVFISNIVKIILAHLSQRLIGEFIGYPWSGVRRQSPVVVRSRFQTSFSWKPLGQSKPNFMWCLLGKGNQSLYKSFRSHDQDGRHAHIWKKPLKIFFSRTGSHMILKLGMQHLRLVLSPYTCIGIGTG